MTKIFSTHNHPSWLKSWPKSNLALSTMRKLSNNHNIKTQNATRQKEKLRHDLSPTSPGHLQEASYQQTGTNSVSSSQYFSESHTCGMSHICLMVEAQFLFVKVSFHGVQSLEVFVSPETLLIVCFVYASAVMLWQCCMRPTWEYKDFQTGGYKKRTLKKW